MNLLLSARKEALSNGIVFHQKKEFRPKVKAPEGNPSPQIETLHYQLVYCAENETQVMQEVKGEIDSLARVKETKTYHVLFNGIYGKKKFLHQRWNYFETLANETYNVDIVNDSTNSRVEFFGRSQDVRGAIDGIVELMKSLAHHKFILSNIEPEKLGALKYLIKSLYQNLRKNTRNARRVEVDDIEDDASEISHDTHHSVATLPASVYCYWYPPHPSKGPTAQKALPRNRPPLTTDPSHLELSIVSLHLHREQFETFKSSIVKFLASYVSLTLSRVIVPSSPRLPVLEIKNSFDLMSFQVRGGDILISGSESMVESAKNYVTELLRGSALESLAANLPSSPKSVLIARFLRLNALESRVSDICQSVSSNFQGVTATIPGNSSQSPLTILMLHGPKNILPNALDFVQGEFQSISRDLEEKILPLQQHEIDFLLKVNDGICPNDPVLIQFPTDEDETPLLTLESTGEKVFLRGTSNVETLSVTAVRCRFEDVGGVLGCECILNPANVRLQHVGGLAKLIANAAGSNFTVDSDSSIAALGQLKPGEARPLLGHDLERYGISVVINVSVASNPTRSQIPESMRSELRLSVKNALSLAEELKITRLGIPGIGTGVYQWPASVSACEIVKAISEWVTGNNPVHLRDIYLFDIDQNLVDEFFNAFSTINETNINLTGGPLGARPTLRDFQWYRAVFPHEPEFNSPGSIPHENSRDRYVPYDYDQVNQLEAAKKSGKPDCLLEGDFHGVKNGVSYLVNFAEMKQTNTKSNFKRDVARLLRSGIIPPLYEQRCAEYDARQSHQSTILPRASLSDLQELNQDYEPPSDKLDDGVRLYGSSGSVAKAERIIRDLLLAGRCEGSISLQSLKVTRVSLSHAVTELTKLLADYNAEFVRLENNDSSLVFATLGNSTLFQISTAGLNRITELIMNDLVIPLPPSWKSTDDDIKLVQLPVDDEEYRTASSCFLQGFRCNIIKIERVQNPCLYREYMKAKQKLADKRGGNPNELLLKHGTRSTPPEKIWNTGDHTNTYGFDPRYSAEGYFGKGAYFAEDTSYSDGYASSITLPEGPAKQMFLAKVAAGLFDQKPVLDRTLLHPSPGFDSVRGPITNSNQGIIIYELHRSYPAYLVTYRK